MMYKCLFVLEQMETRNSPSFNRLINLKKVAGKVFEHVDNLNIHNEHRGILGKISGYFEGTKTMKKFFKTNSGYQYVFVSKLNPLAMTEIKRLAKRYQFVIIYDCVEWASKEEKRLGVLSPSYIYNNYINRLWVNNGMLVISISHFLARHFASKGIKTIVLPNMFDSSEVLFTERQDHGVTGLVEFLFLGYPYKKDALDNIVEAFSSLDEAKRRRVKLSIIGIDEETFFKKYRYLLDQKVAIKQVVSFLGKLDNRVAVQYFSKVDFTVLFRNPKLRVCKAGFPTKFVESLSRSTPVMANISSDLELYLIDGTNGYLVPNFTIESLRDSIIRILSLDTDFHYLRKEAYQTALSAFELSNYVEPLRSFLEEK